MYSEKNREEAILIAGKYLIDNQFEINGPFDCRCGKKITKPSDLQDHLKCIDGGRFLNLSMSMSSSFNDAICHPDEDVWDEYSKAQ